MKGHWCPYAVVKMCQEEYSQCLECFVYKEWLRKPLDKRSAADPYPLTPPGGYWKEDTAG